MKEEQEVDFQGESLGKWSVKQQSKGHWEGRKRMRMQAQGKAEVGFMFICLVWEFVRGNPRVSSECLGPERRFKSREVMVKRG